MTQHPRQLRTQILIVGGGLGGVAAALAALRRGARVILTEEHAWLGGQLTSQGVPPDEHPWIEQFGCTSTYRKLRNDIRDYYRTWYPLTSAARSTLALNPGLGRVSKISHEPRVAAAVIDATLAPFEASGRLTVIRGVVPVSAITDQERVQSVVVADSAGTHIEIAADYVLDATELGDLLPLTGTDYVTGFESQAETGEPSAPLAAQPGNQQAFSWVFAVDHVAGADHTIDRPTDYDHWRSQRPDYWPGPQVGLTAPDPRTLEPLIRRFEPNPPIGQHVIADQSIDPGDRELWSFRRILAREVFEPGAFESDVTIVNWPMIDYVDGPIVDVPPTEQQHHLRQSRELSRSMLYWLQTEAPRQDGGTGWPGLRLRGDVLGTSDGFAMAPYIRESRRIRALTTVTEQDVSLVIRGERGAAKFSDSVGVGMYRIDLHPSSGGDNYLDIASCPFQIPLGALVPRARRNLLAAGKNIGTTHITNGAYRLHPVEWNVGEAAGALAAYCIANATQPSAVHSTPALLGDFQSELTKDGFELDWPQVVGY